MFYFVTTCVKQKKGGKRVQLKDSEVAPGPPEAVARSWLSHLASSEVPKSKAADLYCGQVWGRALGVYGLLRNRLPETKLLIVSAGYGLLDGEEPITPYDVTFQGKRSAGGNSVLAKLTARAETSRSPRKDSLQRWWGALCKERKTSFFFLLDCLGESDYVLAAISKDYMDAVGEDLASGILATKFPDHVCAISNSQDSAWRRKLGKSMLYADPRFFSMSGTSQVTVNIDIATLLIREMFFNQSGLNWWSTDNFNAFLSASAEKHRRYCTPKRQAMTDDEVAEYIRTATLDGKRMASFSALHRRLRESGRACEYGRFKGLYEEYARRSSATQGLFE